jgi:serine/threonine protein kinase
MTQAVQSSMFPPWMPEIALEPRPGDSVGPYRITRIIGRGRMGVVFEGVADAGEPVAIKVVTTELSQDEVFVRRFRREVAAAQKISHANVVPVLASGEEHGLPYLVQKLIPGGSLAERITAARRLDVGTTVRLLGGPAAGIDALHASGLVHRDIKPANILLDGDTAYVSDFGLAKDSQASNLTRPGQALGSLDYMAPEQIRGEDVSPATDIYALGCLIVECLTGTPPFGGRPSMRVLFAHLQEPPPDISEQVPSVSAATSKAVNRALEKEAEDRPASAGGYLQSIARAAGV